MFPHSASVNGGRASGRKAVESGELARIGKLPQSIAARKKNAAKVGRDNAESGELERIGNLPQSKAAQKANGDRQGNENVKSGHWDKVRLRGARIGGHYLWHILRGVTPKKRCEFCENSEYCEPKV